MAKINNVSTPKSSFMSVQKDTSIILDCMLKNTRLKKLLYYTTPDALKRPSLTEEETISLVERNIKTVPKMYVDSPVLNYVLITFDDFYPNPTNPQFRDNTVFFDIVCHFDQWKLEDIELPLGLSIEQDLYVPKRTDLMTAMIRDGMRVPDFIKDNYIASDRCNFESIIILQPNLTDEEKSKVVNDYKEYFKKISDQEVEVDDRGKRKLAYQIKDNTEGYFISYYFDAKEHDISDLEKQYRLDDNVIKFMTIKVSKVAEKVEDRNTIKLQRGEIYSYEDGLKQRVQEKITNEYNDFIEELKKERPEVIIERAYEKVCKEEMLYVFEKNDLSVNECKSLLKCSNILDDCYSEWLKSDGNFNEMLEYAVENSSEHITEDFKREQKQKNKDSR